MLQVFFLSFLSPLASALWPQPVSYDYGDTVLFVQKDVTFFWHEGDGKNVGSIAEKLLDQQPMMLVSDSDLDLGRDMAFRLRRRYTEPSFEEFESSFSGEGVSGDDIVDYAIKSAWRTIFKQSLYPWQFHPRGWEEPSSRTYTASVSEVHVMLLTSDPPDIAKPLAGAVDESYTLELSIHGKATIAANSSTGIARGLTTLTQLFYAHSDGKHFYTPLAPVHIYDAPQFEHRGLNLDVARNWFPVSDIKRQIDALAFNKMNHLHLHITDSQSWPLEIPALPELAAKGAYRPDLVYTPNDFKQLQRHAAPCSHTSIWYSFPDLIAAFNKQPDWDHWAAEPPSGTLKLNSTAVYTFLEKLYADVLPRIHPYSRYFHTGGDEVNKNSYLLDDTVQSNDPAILQPLLQTFIDWTHDKVRSAGLTPIVWEEMLLEWNLTLGPDVVVQSWRSDEAVKQIVQSGHKALTGNYQSWYLDCGKGQWLDFLPSTSASSWPYNDYCAPYHNWRLMYSNDPLSGIPQSLHHLVLGGEAHMWAEQTDPVNVDGMIWPRACAVAEVLWSGAKDGMGRNRSQVEASPRLGEMRERLVMKGVGAESIGMPFCTMGGGECRWG